MSEIEKMYENCNIKPKQEGHCDWDSNCPYPRLKCNDECPYWKDEDEAKYPPFTAKKQLAIVKFLLNKSVYYDTYGDREYWFHISDEIKNSKYREFDEAIAECINKMWDDLRDYEKQQIKEILE